MLLTTEPLPRPLWLKTEAAKSQAWVLLAAGAGWPRGRTRDAEESLGWLLPPSLFRNLTALGPVTVYNTLLG